MNAVVPVDAESRIESAIEHYLRARHELIELGNAHPMRIGGNDNMIGRIGEFLAMQYLEAHGQHPRKATNPRTQELHRSNPGYDFIEGLKFTQVKTITVESKSGCSVRLKGKWNQLVVVELGEGYRPKAVGTLTLTQFKHALRTYPRLSSTPVIRRSMLAPNGLITRFGHVEQGEALAKIFPR